MWGCGGDEKQMSIDYQQFRINKSSPNSSTKPTKPQQDKHPSNTNKNTQTPPKQGRAKKVQLLNDIA